MANVPGSGPGLDVPSKGTTEDHVVPVTEVTTPEPTPPVFKRKLRKAAVGTGCDIRLRVSVGGFPKASLSWYHNEEVLPPSEAQDSGGLWIRDCRISDAGVYTCVASNELGEASCSTVLAIMDLGEDSEATEDESTEPQMETKEGPGRPQDKAGRRGPSGEGGRLTDYNPDAPDRRATLPGTYDPVVERELRTLGSRPPGPHLDPTNPARNQTADAAQGLSRCVPLSSPQPPPTTHTHSSRTPNQDLDQTKSSDQSVNSVVMTPKLARAGPKIFDKVRAFEERRAGVDGPGGAGRSAPCDSDGAGQKTGGPGREGRVLQRREAFKQRASSLEDKTSYSQRVQGYQSKFAEELQRIKKLVGKPSLKKAYSTEQLCQRESRPLGKLEPIPPQVVQKLEARQRALEEEKAGGARPRVEARERVLEEEKAGGARPRVEARERALEKEKAGGARPRVEAREREEEEKAGGARPRVEAREREEEEKAGGARPQVVQKLEAREREEEKAGGARPRVEAREREEEEKAGETRPRVEARQRALEEEKAGETRPRVEAREREEEKAGGARPRVEARQRALEEEKAGGARPRVEARQRALEEEKAGGARPRVEAREREEEEKAGGARPLGQKLEAREREEEEKAGGARPRVEAREREEEEKAGGARPLGQKLEAREREEEKAGGARPRVVQKLEAREREEEEKAGGARPRVVQKLEAREREEEEKAGETRPQVVQKLEARQRVLEEEKAGGAPPRVVQKLEARQRVLEEEKAGGARPRVQGNGLTSLSNDPVKERRTQPDPRGKPADGSSRGNAGKSSVTMETAPVHQLPGQPLPTATRTSLTRDTQASSSRDLGTDSQTSSKAGRRSPSPVGRTAPVGSQYAPKPPRLTPSPTPSLSPLVKRRKAEVERAAPAMKMNIPTILVEDEPVEAESGADSVRRKERRVRKRERGGSARPRPPEEGASSDDSYLSADEEPAEAPRFEKPLEAATGARGSEVTLRCVVTGNPPPTVTWRKDNVEIRSDASHVVKAAGEEHSLLMKQLRPSSAGSYCVTAVSAAGSASCSAPLAIQSETSHTQGEPAAVSLEVRSPIQSDEEYLSPQEEEAMEVGDSNTLSKSVCFKERPSFQVAPCDQGATEGQDVIISAKVRGQPLPMVYWLKDKVAVKTAGRFAVRETDDGIREMRISSAQRSDSGIYVCKIINEYGSRQAECSVEVAAAAEQTSLGITRGARDVAARAGESAKFECHVTGPLDVEVDWLSNGKLIQPALLNCKMHFDGKRCRLLLNSVHEDDSGTYTCKLSTAKEELTSSATLKVTPSKEPLFTRKLDILEVIEGRTARFDCKVSGSPAPRVTWTHFEKRVEESDNVRFLQESGRHSLVITHVSGDTEGFYTAVAQNVHGKAETTAELYMQEPRAAASSHMAKLEKMPSIPEEPEGAESEVEKRTMPDFVKPLADVEVVEGKEVVLRCTVAGLPYPSIAWYHNSKRIESSEERKMTQYRDVHNLVVRSACHAHGGVYKAVVSNRLGKAACYAHLYITDIVPDPPDGPPVIDAITGKNISLSWRRPKRLDSSFDSNSLLYVVQQQPLGSVQWSVVASNLRDTSYTVTSLSKGVRYAFRVVTSTGKTLSKPSASTDLVQLLDRGPYLRKAPVILDKPDVVYLVEHQPASITITLNHVHAAVTWKRRGVVLVNRPGMYEMSMPDDDQHALKLQRVKSTDVGQLVVMASNQFGSDLCTLQLKMAVPPKFETIMEDQDVHVGEMSRLAVVVEGKPDPDILWYKDDVRLSESNHFTFVYDDPEYSLVVLNARPEHSGVYTCTAKNLAASNSCKAEVTVHTERKEAAEPMEDEGTILRKMRRLTDYYDIHKEIGRGVFSYVKRATQKKGKAELAAKFISARGKRKASALREMDLLSELDNERILYFHDAFEKKDVVVLITELCHEEFLERMAKKTTVHEQEIRCSVQQVLEGLRYLHQKNIAHLDMKPENILMASPGRDQIRICDFGNAVKLEPSEEHYCKYGTPEYVAPEIVNQTPVSTATDIWPVGVITYLCLTGVSPFAGENDRATALNIRNYNVAFEESMFSDLCKEAKGFVIKLLVLDRLRPSATECLRHPWFKSPTNKSINTAMLKQVLSRRRWQRSLISYKAKMIMRSIPELLNESSSHVSIAVARHLKEGCQPLSSSSDSDADVDELPFIPMPLSMVFSGSRVSLNEIPGEEDVPAWPSVPTDGTRREDSSDMTSSRGAAGQSLIDEEQTPNADQTEKTKRVPLKKGSSVECDESDTRARRATMRRGSSADSALLLHIDPEEEKANEEVEASTKSLKKSVSMELPNRSPSPGAAKLSQEDYALKLELMRQRLLRGGSVDKKMSGLRGPLFETLGMDEQRQTASLDRNLRRSRAAPPTFTRAASSEIPGEDTPKTKVFRKSSSFTQGDSEPMPLHRRFGAPLEIPSVGSGSIEGRKLLEATSMSALTEQTSLESVSNSPTEKSSFLLPTPGVDQQKQNNVTEHEKTEKRTKTRLEPVDRVEPESRSPSVITPIIVIEEDDEQEERKENIELHVDEEEEDENSKTSPVVQGVSGPIQTPVITKEPAATLKPNGTDTPTLPEHPAVFAKVASGDLPAAAGRPLLRTDIKDIDSEEVFEARFKKRESSLTRGLRKLRNKSEERSPGQSRKAVEGGEEVYRPGPRGAPLEVVSKGLQEKSKSDQDLRVEDKESGLGRIGRFSLRTKRSGSGEKKGEKPKEEKSQDVQEPAAGKRVSWAIGRSKSLDTKELSSAEREHRKAEESTVSSMRRKFESKVAGISAKIRTQSDERKETDAEGSQKDLAPKTDLKNVPDSPVLAMRQKFENKVAEISTKIRSQSEERKGEAEGKRTPLFTRHRHSQSEGRGPQEMGIPENQLAKQAGTGASKESVESTSSVQSEKASESDRRSRWDRWGLTRGKKDKTPSQSDLPSSVPKEDGLSHSQTFVRSVSDFAPVFHIKLKDHFLSEGEPVTLSCLPAGSPHPDITWMKDRNSLEVDDRMNLISHPDGRQLLTITKSSRRDTGIYECVATNPIATITTSCTLSIASVPKRPGTPEVPQTNNNTALVLWKPADSKSPCSYTLERKTEADSKWTTVATRVVDCYYNVTNLPPGGPFRFRVSCVNKAGQGPHSSPSAPVRLDPTDESSSPTVAVVKTLPTPPDPVVTSSVTVPPVKPVHTAPRVMVSTSTSPPTDPAPPAVVAPPPLSSPPAADEPQKKTSSLPSTPTVKPPPPFVLPKPQSPVNVVTPMTQTPPMSPPPPLVAPPSTPTKPAVTSVPSYVPTAAVTARVAPSPVCFSPQVLQASSLSPIGEGAGTPTRGTPSRGTPSGRATPSTALRQGVPQKPYTFLDEKARGRFGVIRECRENATGKIYMAKIIPYSQDNKQDILKEYEILKSLHNEKVMSLHEAYVTPRYLVLVTEYCTGKELLHSLIDRFRYSEDDVVGYLVQILQGVEYLHNRRVLHLDLKPDNILVTSLNAIKIVDFGSAQTFNPLSLRQRDSGVGTLDYMAPEMVKGEVVGPPADMWAVGVVTFIMLSGRLPFEDKNPQQVESKILIAKFDPTKLYPNVSQSASAFLKKMLSSYPWARSTTRDCFTHAWLQDSYLMKLRRQTLTFTSSRLKEFLVEQQCRRSEDATKHKVLLRTYQSSGQSAAPGAAPHVPSPK